MARSHEFLDLLPSDHAEFYSYRKADHSKNKLRNPEDFKRYLESLNFRSRAKTNSDKKQPEGDQMRSQPSEK